MTDRNEIVYRLTEAARCLGATQAKQIYGDYTIADGQVEVGLHKKIDQYWAALAQPEQDAGKCACGANLYIDANGKPCSQALAQPEQTQSMDEWRSMVVVNLLRRCPNLSKHELRELAAHFQSRLPIAQPEPWDASDMAHRAGGLSVEQEHVTCVCKEITTLGVVHRLNAPCFHYTAPVGKPWVGLTDEEVVACWARPDIFAIAHAIEAKLRERNT